MSDIPAPMPTNNATRCANKSCEYYSPKGCTLFAGEAWRRCRKAVFTKKANKKGDRKNG